MKYIALLIVAVVLCVVVAVCAGCGKKQTTSTSSTSSPTATAPTTTEKETKEPAKAPEAKPAKPEAAKPAAPAKAGEWVKLPSGLKYKDIKIGKGPEVKAGDLATVNYKGWLDNGTVFDTSMKPGREPFAFKVGAGQVIPGWDQGVPGMKVGGKRELNIPPALGYGDMEQGSIPANSALHFTVDLVKIGA